MSDSTARRLKELRICQFCGKEFHPFRESLGLYCSRSCGAKGRPPRRVYLPGQRFWPKVDKSGDCWIWTGAKKHYGYGSLSYNKRRLAAHRFAWELTNGPIPAGLHVLHKCDNPPCVNPDHLFLGTQQDNVLDMHQKGRARWARGENHYKAKQSWPTVKAIRERYAAGGISQRKLGALLGTDSSQISRIVNFKIWKEPSCDFGLASKEGK